VEKVGEKQEDRKENGMTDRRIKIAGNVANIGIEDTFSICGPVR